MKNINLATLLFTQAEHPRQRWRFCSKWIETRENDDAAYSIDKIYAMVSGWGLLKNFTQ